MFIIYWWGWCKTVLDQKVQSENLHRWDKRVCMFYLVRMQDASTALMRRLRNPPLSRKWSAWMVAPPGEQTLSFSWPGCCSESRSILAAPWKIRTSLPVKSKHLWYVILNFNSWWERRWESDFNVMLLPFLCSESLTLWWNLFKVIELKVLS